MTTKTAAAKYQPQNRNAIVAKVHVAKKELGLDEETYRALLKDVTGQESTKELTMPQLESVIERLIKQGFKPKKTKADRAFAQDAPSKKIRALWLELNKAGLVKDPNESALCAFVKRQTGVEALQWLTPDQSRNVIEALKKWLGRAPSK